MAQAARAGASADSVGSVVPRAVLARTTMAELSEVWVSSKLVKAKALA